MDAIASDRKQWTDDEPDLESSRADRVSPEELDRLSFDDDQTDELRIIPDESE